MSKCNKKRAIYLIKIISFSRCLVFYTQFVKLRCRGSFLTNLKDESNHNLYNAYTSLRRNSKMKVIAHFKEDGPTIQKLIEELLLECCTIN